MSSEKSCFLLAGPELAILLTQWLEKNDLVWNMETKWNVREENTGENINPYAMNFLHSNLNLFPQITSSANGLRPSDSHLWNVF